MWFLVIFGNLETKDARWHLANSVRNADGVRPETCLSTPSSNGMKRSKTFPATGWNDWDEFCALRLEPRLGQLETSLNLSSVRKKLPFAQNAQPRNILTFCLSDEQKLPQAGKEGLPRSCQKIQNEKRFAWQKERLDTCFLGWDLQQTWRTQKRACTLRKYATSIKTRASDAHHPHMPVCTSFPQPHARIQTAHPNTHARARSRSPRLSGRIKIHCGCMVVLASSSSRRCLAAGETCISNFVVHQVIWISAGSESAKQGGHTKINREWNVTVIGHQTALGVKSSHVFFSPKSSKLFQLIL